MLRQQLTLQSASFVMLASVSRIASLKFDGCCHE